MRPFSPRAAKGLLVIALLIALWETLAGIGAATPQILPSPSAVADKWAQYLRPNDSYSPARHGSRLSWMLSGELPADLVASAGRVLLGIRDRRRTRLAARAADGHEQAVA